MRSWNFCLLLTAAPGLLWPQPLFHADIPKTWDEGALADWATPVAGLNARPAHISSREYYSVPEYSLRSYPVYMPGREPAGLLGHAPAGGTEAIN